MANRYPHTPANKSGASDGRSSQRSPRSAHPRVVKVARIWRKRLQERLLSLMLSIQLLLLFVMPAARSIGVTLPHFAIRGVLLILVLLALAMARSRVAVAIVVLSAALAIAGSFWRHEQPDKVANALSTAGDMLPQLALLWIISMAVFGRGRADISPHPRAIVMYLGIGIGLREPGYRARAVSCQERVPPTVY